MISPYIKYEKFEAKKEILNAKDKTLILFSRLEEPILLSKLEITKLYYIFSFLQEEFAEDYDEKNRNEFLQSEMIYGSLVDCFEEEHFFVTDEDNDVEPRNLQVVELSELPNGNSPSDFPNNNYSNETILAFGHLNSKDTYLDPNDLNLLIKHLLWFANESNRCKPETKMFIEKLVHCFRTERQLISENKPHVNRFILNP